MPGAKKVVENSGNLKSEPIIEEISETVPKLKFEKKKLAKENLVVPETNKKI